MNPTSYQVGGGHYIRYAMQPVELFALTNCDYFRSAIIKYTLRHDIKNKQQDLSKAIHVCNLAQDLGVTKGCSKDKIDLAIIFCNKNNLQGMQRAIVTTAMYGDWNKCKDIIGEYAIEQYGDEGSKQAE